MAVSPSTGLNSTVAIWARYTHNLVQFTSYHGVWRIAIVVTVEPIAYNQYEVAKSFAWAQSHAAEYTYLGTSYYVARVVVHYVAGGGV